MFTYHVYQLNKLKSEDNYNCAIWIIYWPGFPGVVFKQVRDQSFLWCEGAPFTSN